MYSSNLGISRRKRIAIGASESVSSGLAGSVADGLLAEGLQSPSTRTREGLQEHRLVEKENVFN